MFIIELIAHHGQQAVSDVMFFLPLSVVCEFNQCYIIICNCFVLAMIGAITSSKFEFLNSA